MLGLEEMDQEAKDFSLVNAVTMGHAPSVQVNCPFFPKPFPQWHIFHIDVSIALKCELRQLMFSHFHGTLPPIPIVDVGWKRKS